MTAIEFGPAPAHDPLFGVDHAKIAPRLTTRNWARRAAARVGPHGALYVWIARGRYVGPRSRGAVVYAVYVNGQAGFDAKFATLAEALAYANGEDLGRLALHTRKAKDRSEYPPALGTPWIASLGSEVLRRVAAEEARG